jgi:type VI secretion system secreted protein VgrG
MSAEQSYLTLEVEGVDAKFHVAWVRAAEELHSPVRVQVACGAKSTGEALALIGKKAEVRLRKGAGDDGGERVFKGRIREVDDDDGQTSLVIASSVSRLLDTCDYRTFVAATAIDIVTELLSDHGIQVTSRVTRTLTKLEQCVQAFESDLDFCSRILAEEGVTWIAKPDDGETIVLVDGADGYQDGGVDLALVERRRGQMVGEAVHGAKLRRAVAHDKASLRDYDFEHPQLDLSADEQSGSLEWYEYPAGFRTVSAGKTLAKIRLEQLQAESVTLHGETTSSRLQAGQVFSLHGATNTAMNGKWLVVAVSHEADELATGEEPPFSATFRAVPAPGGYRASRRPRPSFGGVETSTATGASGSEIHLDKYGRIKTLLRWERKRAADDQSSAWARVSQPQLSGAIFNPRVGWEELTGFVGVSADRPVILGRLYNGLARPPAGLPDKKVETHFGTMTTPNGTSGNFVKINDTAGSEHMGINSTGQFNEVTENDKVTTIAGNETRKTSANRSLNVKETKVTQVAGAYKVSITGLRQVTTDSNYSVKCGSERVLVGAARLFRVGGDYYTVCVDLTRVVGGAKGEAPIEHQSVFTQGVSAFLVKGDVAAKAGLSEAVGVGGAAIVKISGAKTVKSNGYGLTVRGLYFENLASRDAESAECTESFRSLTYTMSAGGKITGSAVSVEATSKLTIKSSGVTVTMTPSSITIDGDFDGSVSSVEEGNHAYG